jgi:hypothetical protein
VKIGCFSCRKLLNTIGLEEIEKFLRIRVNIQDLRRSSNTMQAQMIDKDSVKTLIEKASSGDRDAFEELLRRHKDRLEALIAPRMGPALKQKVDLEDVYQDTLARDYLDAIIRHRDSTKKSPTSPR